MLGRLNWFSIVLMAQDYSWRFDADTRSAVTGATHIERLSITVNNLSKHTRQSERVSKSFFQTLHRSTALWNLYNRAIDFVVKRLSQLRQAFTFLGRKIVEVSKKWEPAIAQLKGLMVSGAEVAIKAARDIGAGFEGSIHSAQQASEALVELVRSGLNRGEEAAKALKPVLDFSTSSMLSLSKSAKIGAVALKQFGDTGEDLRSIFEIILSASNQATTNVEELSAAFVTAAPAARLLGINAKDLSVMLALMAEKGIVSSKAGRYLNTALIRLVSPSRQAKESLDRLGINLRSLDMSNPVQWLEKFRVALAKVPEDTEKLAIASTIFGKRAVVGLLPLLLGGKEMFVDMSKRVEENRLALIKIRDEITRGLTAAYTRLKNSIQVVYIALKDILDLPLREYYGALTSIVQKFLARTEKVGAMFKKQASDLESWIGVIERHGFKGLFKGFTKEIEPELAKLRQLWTALITSLKAALSAIWDELYTPEVKQKLTKVGVEVGAAIGEGIKIALQSTKIKEAMWKFVETATSPTKLATYVGTQVVKGAGETEKVVKEVQKEKQKGAPFKKFPTLTPTERINLYERTEEQEEEKMTPADIKLWTSVRQQQEQYRQYRQKLQDEIDKEMREKGVSSEEAERRAHSRRGRRAVLAEYRRQQTIAAGPEDLEDKEKFLGLQLQLIEAQKEYGQRVDEANTFHEKLNITIAKQETFLKKALLEPWDKFRQKLLEIRERFAELLEPLKQKKIDLFERLGITKTPEAERLRLQLQKESYRETQERLKIAQSPAEKAKIYERLAERAGALHEAAPESQQYKQEARRYIEQAIVSRKEQQQLEEKKLTMEKELHLTTIRELEAMTAKGFKSPERALETYKQLQTALLEIGKPVRAQALQADILKSRREMAGRTNSLLEKILEREDVGNRIAEKAVEIMQQIAGNTGDIADAGGGPIYDEENQAP